MKRLADLFILFMITQSCPIVQDFVQYLYPFTFTINYLIFIVIFITKENLAINKEIIDQLNTAVLLYNEYVTSYSYRMM